MKTLLKNPWFIGGLGMLALGLIIYFVGPLIGFGESQPLAGRVARLVTIFVIVLIWVVILLLRRSGECWLARREKPER